MGGQWDMGIGSPRVDLVGCASFLGPDSDNGEMGSEGEGPLESSLVVSRKCHGSW